MTNRVRPTASLLLVTVLAAAAFAQVPAPATRPTSAPTLGEPRLVLTRDGIVSVGNAAFDIRRLADVVLASAWANEPARNLMREAGLSEQAARQALALRPNANGWTFRLVLSLPRDTPGVRQAATAFLDALPDRVVRPAAEQLVAESRHIPVERAQRALAEARERAAETSQDAAKRRQQVRAAAQVLDPSPDAVRQAASRLDQERQKVSLELAGQAARQRALEERVAKLSDAAASRVDKDPIAAELEKIVNLREREAAATAQLRQQGGVSEAASQTAQAAVAEAKARLLERRESAARAAGSDLLADLNKELVTLTISIAENEARQKYIQARLDGLGQALELADDLEQSIATATRARRQVDFAESQLQEARARAEQLATDFPVSVAWGDPAVDGTGGGGGGGGGGLFGGGGGGGGGGK